MLYNDSSTSTGICQEIDSLCGTNSTNYPLADKNRRLNSALDDYFHISMKACGDWSVEDMGKTDFPVATTNLIANQTNYTFPSDLLILERVETSDSAGNWTLLTPFVEKDVTTSLTEWKDTPNIPNSYRKVGNSIFIYPASLSNVTSGLKIYYRRAFTYSTLATSTFTPTSPAIPSVHHTWLAYSAALPFLVSKSLARKNDIAVERDRLTKQIEDYYTIRERDKARTIRPIIRSSR